MSGRLIGFFVVLLLGTIALAALYYYKPDVLDPHRGTSDAGKADRVVNIGTDNWIGYIPLCGKEMRRRMHASGYLLRCIDDSADYAARMKKLRSGELQLAVATVDSFLLNAASEKFPAVIVGVLDESKGGDALIAHKDRIANLEELKKRSEFRIAFTPASPSEHLLKAVGTHFDVPALRDRKGKWRVEVSGSSDALKRFEAKEVDAAVLWEPDVSRALEKPGRVKLLGTEDTRRLIVDILLASRDTLQKSPETTAVLLGHYFRTLKYYRDNPQELTDEVRSAANVSETQATIMLKGVRWITLTENASDWFGITLAGRNPSEGLIDTIEATSQILIDSGDFSSSPIPERDPYRLQYRRYIEELQQGAVAGQFQHTPGAQTAVPADKEMPAEKNFAVLSDAQWNGLIEVGTLKIRPITFQTGTADLSYEGKVELDNAVQSLTHYPNFRIVLKGHTGMRGDAAANQQLARERADAVKRYLVVTHNLSEARLHALGFGSAKPLTRLADESDRAYDYRLPRVELSLVAEAY